MALSRAAVPGATGIAGTTSVTTTWPAGYTPTAGDTAVLVVFSKHRTEATEPDAVSGWSKTASVLGGVTGAAVDAGKVRITVYTRALTGGDTAPTVTITTGTGVVIACGQPYVYTPGAGGTVDVDVTGYSYATSTLSWTANAAGPVDLVAGDELVFAHGSTSDSVTGFGVRNLSAGGLATGTSNPTEQLDASTTNGDDLRYTLANNNVTSGQATAGNPTVTATLTGTASTGAGALIRVRELAAKVVTFDGGVDGDPIPVAGDVSSVNGTPVYTSDAKHGGTALRGVGTAAGARVYHGQTREHSGSAYLKVSALDTGANRSVQLESATGALVGSIRLHSDGHVDIANASNARQVASTLSWTQDAWLRVDWQVDSPGTGLTPTLTVRIFLAAESSTHDEQISTAALAAADALRYSLGALGGDADTVATVDTFRAVAGLQWLGPFVSTSPVTADLDTRWRVLARVIDDSDLRWRVLAGITDQLDLRWRVLTAVTDQLDTRWRVLARVSDDCDLRWRVLATAAAQLDTRWRVLTGVTDQLDLQWRVLTRITDQLDTRWRVLATAAAQLDVRWAVSDIVTVPVSGSVDLRWQVSGRVVDQLDVRWSTSGHITRQLDLRWQLAGHIAGQLDLRWASLATTTADADLRWRVLVIAPRDINPSGVLELTAAELALSIPTARLEQTAAELGEV